MKIVLPAPDVIREPAPDLIREPAPDLIRGLPGQEAPSRTGDATHG